MATMEEAIVASFRCVPPAAVPAMLDCVLASTSASPSSIFSALLNEFPNITKVIRERNETIVLEWRNIIVSYVAALSHFLKKSGASHMPMFIWKMLIPLLKLLHARDCELFNEVARLFFDVVKETKSWEVLEMIMMPLLLRSIGLSVGMFQSEDLAIYKWNADSTFSGLDNGEVSPQSFHDQLTEKNTYEEFSASYCCDLPLAMSCNVLTLTLDAALRSDHEGVVSVSTSEDVLQAKVFAGNVLWDLTNLTLQMLSTSLEHRSSAIKLLLPFIFKAFSRESTFEVSVCGRHHLLTRTEFFVKIWESCKLLFSLGSLERRDAYDVLSLYLSFPSPIGELENIDVSGRENTFDIRADQQFWDEIKRGLLDKESLVRKQSLHILKTTLNLNTERNVISEEVSDLKSSETPMMSKRGRWADNEAKSLGIGRICNHTEPNDTGRQRWETFVFLYEMLEEYGTHLVEAAWSHQIRTCLQSSFPSENSVNSDPQCDRMTTAKQLFEWLAVLWERGLCHDNPQVRCLIMQSLLAVEWERYGHYVKLMPKDFILGPLIRGLNDPVHHKGFGLKEFYSSLTIDAAAGFLREYVSYMDVREHIFFLVDLASVPKTYSLGRAGLMCLAECIASAAYRAPKQSSSGNKQLIDAISDIVVVHSGWSSCQNDRSDLLDGLRFVLECSKHHFNPKYRRQVCGKILAAATILIPANDVPLEILMNFVSSMPREYTDYGGSLRCAIQKWLCGPKSQLLSDICGFPKTFVSCQNPRDSFVTYNDEELDAWESEAKRWARVLFLLVEEEQFYPITKLMYSLEKRIDRSRPGPKGHRPISTDRQATAIKLYILLNRSQTGFPKARPNPEAGRQVLLATSADFDALIPFMQFIEDHGHDICKQNSTSEWLAVKFLILVSSLVQELQVIQERTAKSRMTRRKKTDFDVPGIIDHPYSKEESLIFDKFVIVLLSCMEELVSFTKLSCSIFWLPVVTEDVTLPGSIRGKLGGPSQRRLSSSLCSSVLAAITSIKTLAFISWWCAQFRSDVLINCANAFLWDFCWKIIKLPTCKSEVEAEICIGAHESCAYLLKYLVPMFSLFSIDLVVNNDASFPREAEYEGLLDAFISTFVENINNVIDGGSLARTRRAILMKWKWSCLESLLLLPNYASRSRVDPGMCKNIFSGTVVKKIFDDLIGSLENAGESSVLSMLRSVRISIKLLASERSGPLFSSSEGITIQMMWLLVHSSWILHISCNKRRVAPIAALLSSVLHSSLFGNEAMHEFDGEPGPLKWFVEKILEEGTKSPRTIRLAALHLSGLWLAYPNTLRYYMEELKLLTFYGSVAFDEDFEAELVENFEASTEVSVLSRSLDPELTEGFINTELYARVSIAVLFSKLADMVDLANSTIGDEDTLLIAASGKMFLLELLDSVVNDKDLSKELYKKYSAIHRRKVRAWQMICILSRFVDVDVVDQVTSSLHTSIYRNNLPSVRQYMETFAIHVYLKFPVLVGQQLVCFLRSYDLRPQALSSYVFIAANVILHSKEMQSRNLGELLPPIIPLLTSHHHTLRGFTQILVYKVLQTLPDLNSGECASISLEKRCFLDLRSYLEQNSDCARLRASMDSYLDGFDPVMSISPAGIFTNRVEESEFECAPATLMERVIEFLNNTREDLRSSMAKDAAAIKNESLHIAKGPRYSEKLDSNGEESVLQPPKEIIYDFQKKITVSKHGVQDASTLLSDDKELYRSLLDMENEDQLLDQLLHSRGVVVEKSKASRQQIILMASLIDRIPNLAGLARTCEVFRAAGLAIADKNILNDKQFQLISVTAEKWVPLLEVPLGSMKVFLEKKKQEGFAILGLEQTANSIPLDHYKFPTKTVLVLGREKEGIPVEFIHMLDACIEIPQLGIVRSLNVHVSGAIALWEYTRQQRSP